MKDKPTLLSLDLNKLDEDLSEEERNEWNAIYASYRSKSILTGRIMGIDTHSFTVRNRETRQTERRKMLCAVIINYRVKVLIPETEVWYPGQERPPYVLRNMSGAETDYIGSRRQAVISGKYGGGVFCTLSDETVCLCHYSTLHSDLDFHVGDTVILAIKQFDYERSLIYGRILSKW